MWILAAYLAYIFLPIVLLVVGSFGENWTNTLLPHGVSGRWYVELWGEPSFRRAFVSSLQIALGTCLVVTLTTVPLAYALSRGFGRWARLGARFIAVMPISAPAVVLGFGFILVFSSDQLPLLGSFWLLLAAHVVVTLPYMFQTLVADIRHLELEKLELAAQSLGAGFWRRMVDIVLPSLRHSILSGLVIVAAISIGEFALSNLVAGLLNRTYPIVLLQAFYGATGLACAATVVLLFLAALAAGAGVLTARATAHSTGGKK